MEPWEVLSKRVMQSDLWEDRCGLWRTDCSEGRGESRETRKEAAVVELKHLQKLHQTCG